LRICGSGVLGVWALDEDEGEDEDDGMTYFTRRSSAELVMKNSGLGEGSIARERIGWVWDLEIRRAVHDCVSGDRVYKHAWPSS
jgi:hypothetical protein